MPTPSISMKELQAADELLGRIACSALAPLRLLRRSASSDGAPRFLLIKFWGLGSLQLLTPAVRALRAREPHAHLTLLTLRSNEEFARGLGVFDEVATLDVAGAGWVRVMTRILRLFARVRAARFDRVYDFEFFTRFSSIVSLATGAPRVRGFAAPSVNRGGFHTERVPFNRYWHVARNFRALAEGENGEDVEAHEVAPFPVRHADDAAVRALLSERGLVGGAPYCVFNANAGELSLERRWPPENFSALARRGILEDGLRVVFVGSAAEAPYVARIVAAVGPVPPGHLVDLSGALDVGRLAALLRGATAVVSNDSGPMHLAAALGTPTLGLFGPETPVMYAPLGARCRALWDPPMCSPCINVHDNKVATCIHGRPECLVNLGVERVFEELRFALGRTVLRPVGPAAPPVPEPPTRVPAE